VEEERDVSAARLRPGVVSPDLRCVLQAERRDFAAFSSVIADVRVGRSEDAMVEILNYVRELVGRRKMGIGTCGGWLLGEL